MRNARFLLVDESKIIKNAIAKILVKRIGCEPGLILTAKNGLEALDILEKEPIDVIICEWHVSHMDGLALIDSIRKNSALKEIPFVMMSTDGSKEAVVTSIQQGVSQYLVKPFSPERFEDAVRKAWNGTKRRAAQRFSGLPTHRIHGVFKGVDLDAQMVDISRSGGLLTLTYNAAIELFGDCELHLEFDDIDEIGLVSISPIPAQILRIEASRSFHHSTRKCEVAVAFLGDKVDKTVQANLDKLLGLLADKESAIFKVLK